MELNTEACHLKMVIFQYVILYVIYMTYIHMKYCL